MPEGTNVTARRAAAGAEGGRIPRGRSREQKCPTFCVIQREQGNEPLHFFLFSLHRQQVCFFLPLCCASRGIPPGAVTCCPTLSPRIPPMASGGS
eukprot:1971467-Rhodomonas_salina.1